NDKVNKIAQHRKRIFDHPVERTHYGAFYFRDIIGHAGDDIALSFLGEITDGEQEYFVIQLSSQFTYHGGPYRHGYTVREINAQVFQKGGCYDKKADSCEPACFSM